MELSSLQSPSVSGILRSGLIELKPFLRGQMIKLSNTKRYPNARNLKLTDFRAQASAKFSSEAVEAIPKVASMKDENLVFVAGATGRVGSRTVRELLKLGFRVRAGVRSVQRAESLVQSVKQLKFDESLEIVEFDLEKRDQIGPAIGNASVVLCCIGASEKEIFDITGPYRIDYQATKNLIDAAAVAKVNHFILLTSLGTNKIGFPAAILNLFWGVLIWKRKAEEALLASGIPYTIVRPGGMERPTDSYKETHNITVAQEDTLFGGQVSKLQVAEVMAFMAKKRSLSYCKVVEVIAETTAPLTPMAELLEKIPSQRVDAYPLKERDAAEEIEAAMSKSITFESAGISLEKKPTQEKATVTSPLSPFIVYEDLKPPTSPTPTPSNTAGAIKARNVDMIPKATNSTPSSIEINALETSITAIENEAIQTDGKKSSLLSPYTNYEELKPPSSPSPTPSGPKAIPSTASTPAEVSSPLTGGNDIAKVKPTAVVEKDPPQDLTFHHSPYPAYEDLKPPTTPTPSPRKL